MSKYFTPILDGKRVNLQRSKIKVLEGDPLDTVRGVGRRGVIEVRGKVYKVYGRACGLPGCQCDAEIVEVDRATLTTK